MRTYTEYWVIADSRKLNNLEQEQKFTTLEKEVSLLSADVS
jgi:hypothetical protein